MIKKILNITGLVLGVALTLGMTGYAFANAASADKMLGVVVAKQNAALEVADQPGVGPALKIDRVLAPGASWVVVHLDMDGKPGKRVGLLHVDSGESRDLSVALGDTMGADKLLVALHADRGIADRFEFDMDKFDSSPDKPYFVDAKELATAVSVR